MKDGLESAYEMVVESQKEGTVKSSLKPGAAAAGAVTAKLCGALRRGDCAGGGDGVCRADCAAPGKACGAQWLFRPGVCHRL